MKSFPVHFAFFALTIGLCCMATACKKQEVPVAPDILIADAKGMVINDSAQTITGFYNIPSSILLDVDTDGSPDIDFTVNIIGSPGMGQHPHASVQSLHAQLGFYGFRHADTTWLDEVLTIHQDENYVYHQTIYNFNCQKLTPFYNFYSVAENFHLQAVEANEALKGDALFVADTLSFIQSWNSPMIFYSSHDTVYSRQSFTNFSCFALPHNLELYVGFKLQKSPERLGWLKFIINSNSSITLKEWAIQSVQ